MAVPEAKEINASERDTLTIAPFQQSLQRGYQQLLDIASTREFGQVVDTNGIRG
jgi:hypothetical protein